MRIVNGYKKDKRMINIFETLYDEASCEEGDSCEMELLCKNEYIYTVIFITGIDGWFSLVLSNF